MTRKITIFLVLFIIPGIFLYAQDTYSGLEREKLPGENLIIKVAYIGPGDPVYHWWSHIALVIENSQTGDSRFYDYGIFSFDYDDFYWNFALGRLIYSTASSSTTRSITHTINQNRTLKLYTLDLPPETKVKIKDFAEKNVLPENRFYQYHHFMDNCSTRIRDIIDLATYGQFKEYFTNSPSRFTFREHIRCRTWYSPAIDWIFNFWMGQVIDKPITKWEDMFLPAEVIKLINEFWYTDKDGNKRKLVINEEIIFESTANRPVMMDNPKPQWPRLLGLSLALSAIFAFFFFLYSKKILIGRILAGISMTIYGLVFGLAGLLLYFVNIFTEHDYAFENANVLFSGPWLLAAIPLGLSYAFTKKQEKLLKYDLRLRIIWLITIIGIIISMLIKLLPWFFQYNLGDQLLMLPMVLVFALQPVGLGPHIDKYFRQKKHKRGKRGN
jgi:hypothetical protein